MTYKEMLDKLAELEHRVDALERGQRKQTQFPGAPQFTPGTLPHHGGILPVSWTITNKGTLQ